MSEEMKNTFVLDIEAKTKKRLGGKKMKNAVLTQERADILSGILSSDEGVKIFSQEPNEVLEKINGGLGHNFTLDEVNEYVRVLSKRIEQGKLSDGSLEGVAGGANGDMGEDFVITITSGALIAGGLLLGGGTLGFAAARV